MTLKLLIVLLFFTGLVGISPAQADESKLKQYIPNVGIVGEYDFSFLLWDVYDASFYAPEGSFSKDEPFALKLDYKRRLTGEKIAERTTKEIREQGFNDEAKLSEWLNSMSGIIPDVDNGDTIIGIKDKNSNTIFYLNGKRLGLIQDPEFTKVFFDIWLSSKTSQPQMRKALLRL